MPSIVGADAAVKIVHLLLIVDQNVRHIGFTSFLMVLPAIAQEWRTFQLIFVYEHEVQ